MKSKLLAALFSLALLTPCSRCLAAETNDISAETKEIISKVQAKLKEGKTNETDFAVEIKSFDDLLAKHKDEKTDEVAGILNWEAMLYVQVLHNTEKGDALNQRIKTDFPDTVAAKSIRKQEAAKAIQTKLVIGAKFPDFAEKDVAGKPLSIASYKGKVVLVDFWATWCPPCVRELPNVLKTYENHHQAGFEIIGISLDQTEEKLTDFVKQKNMAWQQFFDGKGWGNKLAEKYGIMSIPMTFLLDGEGKIIGKDLRGEDLEDAVVKALPKS